jgi:hypothetical protein
MSVNFNRKELEKFNTSKEYKCKLLLDDPYAEDCWAPHNRQYKTWKYNRRKQYREK